MVDNQEINNFKDRYKGMNLPFLICIICENGEKVYFKDTNCV